MCARSRCVHCACSIVSKPEIATDTLPLVTQKNMQLWDLVRPNSARSANGFDLTSQIPSLRFAIQASRDGFRFGRLSSVGSNPLHEQSAPLFENRCAREA